MQTTSNGESEHEGGQLYCRRYSHTGREQSCWMGLRQNLRFLRLFIIRHRRLHSLTPGRGSFPRNECNGDFSPIIQNCSSLDLIAQHAFAST